MYAVISEISLAQDLQTIVSFYVEEYLEVADNLTWCGGGDKAVAVACGIRRYASHLILSLASHRPDARCVIGRIHVILRRKRPSSCLEQGGRHGVEGICSNGAWIK